MSSEHEHTHHITPISKLTWTFGMLIILMVVTIAAAKMHEVIPGGEQMLAWFNDNPWLTNPVALAIAITKATLVISIFMGVKYAPKLVKVFAALGFVWMFLLLFMLVDYWARPWEPVRGWEKAASTGLPREASRADGQDKNYVLPRNEKAAEAH